MAADTVSSNRTASGVDALIARLHGEGVASGKTEAERLVAEAQSKARSIVENAEAQAAAKLSAARTEIDNHRRAGQEALTSAARDTVLDLKDQLTRRFAGDVAKLVGQAMRDDDLLRRMILEVAGRARVEGSVDKAAQLDLVLPRSAVGLDDLQRKPEELREGTLTHFAVAVAGDMLREGVTFKRADDDAEGIKVVMRERGVSVDISDQAVALAILAHLQPRFRALMEGVVQ